MVAFSQYLLRDDLPLKGVPRASRYAGFESGLRTAAGKDKPALAGFRLPVAAKRRGSRVSLWGLVRPATTRTRAVVEVSDHGRRYRRLTTVRTSAATSWTTRTAYRAGRRYRVVWTAPGGRTYRSPGVARLSLASNFPRRHGRGALAIPRDMARQLWLLRHGGGRAPRRATTTAAR